MAALEGQAGELRFTLQITRKDTGQVEELELIGRITDEQLKELQHARPTDRNPGDDAGR